MKLAGLPLRRRAAALLTTMTIGAAIAPGVVAANTSSVAPSAEHLATNRGACYEQVVEYMYQRETFRTEHKYVKETHERSRQNKSDPWGPWSAWTVWNGGSTTRWEGPNFSEEGDHDGQNDDNSTFDRDYRYVQTGETRQVSAGFETTGWLTAPPAGDGWGQIDQRTVQGDRIPCDTQPEDKVEYTEWGDGRWQCGDTEVSQTRTKTVTPYVLQDYTWVPGTPQVTTETQTRSLTDAEIQSCKPDDRTPTYTEWTDGHWECGDTTVTQTRTRTDYAWVNTGGSTWVLQSTETVETQTRELTQDELCSIDPPTVISGYDCVTDQPTALLSPATGSTWTATGDQDDSPLGYKFVVTANAGYTFSGAATVALTGTIDDSDRSCEGTPEAPKVTASEECGVVDTYTIPSTLDVVYLVDGEVVEAGTYELPEGSTVVVTAKAAPGYRLLGALNESLEGGPVELCPPTEWQPPTQEPVCGPDNDMVAVPEDTSDVSYQVSGWVDGERTVTALWTYDDSEIESWTFTDANETCPEEPTPAPTPPSTEISSAGGAPTTTTPAAPLGQLPQTGSSTGAVAAVAAALLLAGGVAMVATRRSTAAN